MHKTFEVQGMSCAGCGKTVQGVIEQLHGVQFANASFREGRVEVEFNEIMLTETEIARVVHEAGYKVVFS